jgi:hypothetical protein
MRTLYDGISFEEVRRGVTFRDGSYTTRGSEGIETGGNLGTEGSRYRWIGSGGGDEIRTRSEEETERTVTARYTGVVAALYINGEAMGMNRSGSTGSRGGMVYLGKELLGSVRSTSGEYGGLEERYEYDVFGVPFQGDLTTGMDLGYTGKPYDASTGLYNYGYRD